MIEKKFSRKIVSHVCKAGKWIEDHNFLSAVFLNIIVLEFVLVFCEIKYETSDDYIMSKIVSGAYGGEHNPHLIYINIIVGFFLKIMYAVVPQISWYLILQLGISLVGCTAFTYVILKRMPFVWGYFFAVVFLLVFAKDLYIVVQFTKTATMSIMSGSICFLDGLFSRRRDRVRVGMTGACLVLAGSLIRFNAIYIAGGFILLIVVEWMLKERPWITQIGRKHIWKCVLSGVVLICLVLLGRLYDHMYYNADVQYKRFSYYGQQRSRNVDRAAQGYEALEESLRSEGVSYNDYQMVRQWNFADREFFTAERLENIARVEEAYRNTQKIDGNRMYENVVGRSYGSYPSLWGISVLLLMSLLFNRKRWGYTLAVCIVSVFYLVYFFLVGRVLYRIEWSIFVSAYLSGCFYWSCGESVLLFRRRIVGICIFISCLFLLGDLPIVFSNWTGDGLKEGTLKGNEYRQYIENLFYYSWSYDARRYGAKVHSESGYAHLKDEMETHPNNVYFLDFATTIQSLYPSEDPLFTKKNDFAYNAVYFAGILTEFPDLLTQYEKNNITNPMDDLLKDNVYIVDNYRSGNILAYLREHYSPYVEAEKYKTLDGFDIWKYTLNDEAKETYRWRYSLD